MITKVHIKGYRKFKELIFQPNKDINIIVGMNESGKTTLLEAITMALTGRHEGYRATEAFNPYWFNNELVDKYFASLRTGRKANPLKDLPEFRIDVHLETERGERQKMRGIHNMLGEDSVGLSIHAYPDPEYCEELAQYLKDSDCPKVLPIEYYRLDWRDFANQPVYRQPKGLGVAVIDTRTIRSDRGMDYYTRQLLEERLDARTRTHVSAAHRKMKSNLADDLLDVLNTTFGTDLDNRSRIKLGVQVDQSRSTAWENTLTPSINNVPFSQSGKGIQAIAKTLLAIGRTAQSSSYLLIEEPENHLSHTRLRELLSHISGPEDQRQVFITTHSSYVLNRLGLNQLILLHNGKTKSFTQLSCETTEYFKRLSGFDTLRLILADKVVLVEGPSDEMIFNRFFYDRYGAEPLDYGVDVISIRGTSFRRAFELASLLDRQLVALRDTDEQQPNYWKERIKEYTKPNIRTIHIGDPSLGKTLEPQITSANDNAILCKALGLESDADPSDWMKKHKTDAALKIATSRDTLTPPPYFKEAIDALSIPSLSRE